MKEVHNNSLYCTVSCRIKVLCDVMFDNRLYVDTAFVVKMTRDGILKFAHLV